MTILMAAAREPREQQRLCERAVITAYRELRAVGFGELGTFRSCITLYRIHHPEAELGEARARVSEWIDRDINASTAAVHTSTTVAVHKRTFP